MNTGSGSTTSDNVRPVKRVKHGVLLILAAAAVVSGCTTFSDNDAVARVDDEELSAEALSERLGEPVEGLPADGDAARDAINGWILEQVGGSAADVYALGVESSGTVCVQVLLVDTEEAAATAESELVGGANFETVFADYNVDPSLTLDTANLGCIAAAELPVGQGNAFVDSLPLLTGDDPVVTAALADENGGIIGYSVARLTPFDLLSTDDVAIIEANQPIDPARVAAADIYIDPRYGSFDPQFGAVPLG